MNLIMHKSGMKLLDSVSKGTELLKFLARNGLKNLRALQQTELQIMPLAAQDYFGYCHKPSPLVCDLLFSCKFLKQMRDFISPAFNRLLLTLAANEFTSGQKYREQGAMKSLLIPNTNRQKVIHFCPLRLPRLAYVLIEVGEAADWNFHQNSLAGYNDFRRKAASRQQYYEPIYHQSLLLAEWP